MPPPRHPCPPLPHARADTKCLASIDAGHLPEWKTAPAPPLAVKYWRLKESATMYDVLMAVRADEAIHRDVNHVLASLPPGAPNPFL